MRNYCVGLRVEKGKTCVFPVLRVRSTDVAGGPVRRSRTFAVSQKRQKQNRRFCRDTVRLPDESRPEAARLAAAYNLRISRHRQAVSAGTSYPLVPGHPATSTIHYSLFIIHLGAQHRYIVLLPSNALVSVTSSAYSSSAPTGTP